MSISWSIPRNCLAWLLIAMALLIVPHIEMLPWWVLIIYLLCGCWRVMVYQGRWSYPRRWLKNLLALLCVAGIVQSYDTVIGLEPTVTLLFTGFALKLLEISQKRDVYVILFIGYFVALTAFLFSQQFSITVLVFGTVLLITTALVALHQQRFEQFNWLSLRKSALILLQALPLMLLLFIVFPRIEPFWKVPMSSSGARSGVSDSMGPGDISELSRSGELAFQAIFEGPVPAKNQLYWRGLVLSQFDGRRWHQGRGVGDIFNGSQARAIFQQFQNPLRYQIIQEASYQPWLFALALAYSRDPTIKMANDYRLLRSKPTTSRFQYSLLSDPGALFGQSLSSAAREFETALPAGTNPQATQFAQQLWAQSASTQQFVQAVLTKFRQENYIYSLKPPLLGEHSVDDFLFRTRKGFCSYYASSFVFLMRAAGVPARVVVGYQGGEISPITGNVLVHQFDAHAWAEVWLPNKGWQRVDPTAAVSPLRIESGLEAALLGQGDQFLAGSLLSPLRYRDIAWLNALRMQMDAFNYYWTSWVLGYQGQQQSQLLRDLLGELKPWRVAALLLGVGGVVLAIVGFTLLRGRGKIASSPEVKLYLQLCRRLQRAGFSRLEHEGPIDFSRRISEPPSRWSKSLMAATRAFVTLSYEPLAPELRSVVMKQLRVEVLKVSVQLRTK